MTIDWDLSLQCAQNTLNHPREHPDSRCFATITVNTKIGPVLHYIYIYDNYLVFIVLRYRACELNKPNYSSWIMMQEDLRDSWMIFFCHPCSSLFKQRNDPEHVVIGSWKSGTLVLGNWVTWKTGSRK